MKRMISLLLLLIFLTACTAPAGESDTQTPDAPEAPADAAPEEDVSPEPNEAEDHVLLTLEAPLADGRTLTLEAVGRVLDEYSAGVREVRVYDGEDRIQTLLSRDANEIFWGGSDGGIVSEYTSCWDPEDCMEALDLNFDGNTDFGLFGWIPNNTIPYYYWLWDEAAGEYRYAFALQGAEARPETRELSSAYKSGLAGSQWITEYYKPDENGDLFLSRVERSTCDFEPDPPSLLDVDRGWAEETWVPPEGREPIPPGDDRWIIEADLVLVRREIPIQEINAGNTFSYFTEIWERKDGELKLTSREEYFYDDTSE